MTRKDQRHLLARGCLILLTSICCCFLWLAITSFDVKDSPSPYVWPYPEAAHNAGGLAGAWVAYYMFAYLGWGAYAVVVGLTAVLGVLACKGQVTCLWQRILGIALLTTVLSCAAHILTSSDNPTWLEMRGGVLGYAVAGWLQPAFNWMTLPILVYGLLVGAVFTAEEFVYQLPAAWRKRREQIREAAGRAMKSAPRTPPFVQHLRRAGSWLWTHCRPRPSLAIESVAVSPPAARTKAVLQPQPKRGAVASAVLEADEDEEIDEPTLASEANVLVDEEGPDTSAQNALEDEDTEEEIDNEDLKTPALPPPPPVVINYAARPKPAAATPTVPMKAYPAELEAWELPPISLLQDPEYTFSSQQEAVVREKARVLEKTLQEYRIEAVVVEIDTGPVITMFEVQVAPGIKVSQIVSLANDIARALKAPSVRVVAPIPGKNTIGIEVPNLDKEKVRLKELVTVSTGPAHKMALPLFLGKDASGGMLVADLAQMPHMLIAGTTGSGKSVCINSIIASVLLTQRPDVVKLILVDPKMVEMSMFREVPHLMCPIVTEMERAEKILEWATVKMDERYALLAEAGVRNIAAYNRLSKEEKYERFQPTTDQEKAQIPIHLPYVVIVIDELADLMMMSAKEVELHLSRLAQKSRAVGIHIIVATQRPEAKIVTGLIKSNLPCRVAFRVASRMDSRIVLDQNGAEVLMGQGDMLYLPPGSSKLVRAQGTYLEDAELKAMINFLKERAEPEFHPELMQIGKQDITSDGPRDELFDQAVEVVLETRRGSVSLLQRRLTIGYSRASRLIEEMAVAGIVGTYKGSQAREVLITSDEWQALKEQQANELRARVLDGDGVPDMLYDDDM
ncbi:MAG: DNA translocase FtsK [Phycisphaerales bacterium]|nr:DNA translocase FtsK [Phycisphaerales bacterium]